MRIVAPFRARLSATTSTALTRPSPAVTAYSNVRVFLPEPVSYHAVRASGRFCSSPRRTPIDGAPPVSSTTTSSQFGGRVVAAAAGPVNLTSTRTVSPAVHAPSPPAGARTLTWNTRVRMNSGSPSPPASVRIVAPRSNSVPSATATPRAPASAAPTR